MDGPMEDTESVCLPIEEKVPVLLLNDVALVLEKAIEGNCVTVVVVVVVILVVRLSSGLQNGHGRQSVVKCGGIVCKSPGPT